MVVGAPQPGDPQGHVFDDAVDVVDGDRIAHAVLVFDGERESREKSRTTCWAPKPMVAPMMVALASRGVRLIPSMPKMMATATTQTKNRQMVAASPAMVVTRAPARSEAARWAAWLATRSRTRLITLGTYLGRHQGDQGDQEDGRRTDDEIDHRAGRFWL